MGGSACSLFLRKCKITTYILFWPILLKTILIQPFSHVELDTTQYDRRRDLVTLLRSTWVTSNATRKLDSLWERWYEKKQYDNLSRLRSYICMSAVKTPSNPRGSQGRISHIPWHPTHYSVFMYGKCEWWPGCALRSVKYQSMLCWPTPSDYHYHAQELRHVLQKTVSLFITVFCE